MDVKVHEYACTSNAELLIRLLQLVLDSVPDVYHRRQTNRTICVGGAASCWTPSSVFSTIGIFVDCNDRPGFAQEHSFLVAKGIRRPKWTIAVNWCYVGCNIFITVFIFVCYFVQHTSKRINSRFQLDV